MNNQEFNLKYKDKIEKGFKGLEFNNEKVIDYLDKKFENMPDLIFSQIKLKFGQVRFYCNLSLEESFKIEQKIQELLNEK